MFKLPDAVGRGTAKFLRNLKLDGLKRLKTRSVEPLDFDDPFVSLEIETSDAETFEAVCAVVNLVSTPPNKTPVGNYLRSVGGGQIQPSVTRVYAMPKSRAAYIKNFLINYSQWDFEKLAVQDDGLVVRAELLVHNMLGGSLKTLEGYRQGQPNKGGDSKTAGGGSER